MSLQKATPAYGFLFTENATLRRDLEKAKMLLKQHRLLETALLGEALIGDDFF